MIRLGRRFGIACVQPGIRIIKGRLSRRTVSTTTVEARASQQSSRLFERITSACAAILRGIISPCRWREFVEPTIAKRVVETAEVNIKCAFRGCPSGLQEASFEGICGKLAARVADEYAVGLVIASVKVRCVKPSLNVVPQRDQVFILSGI
jgi:hypothetical protein